MAVIEVVKGLIDQQMDEIARQIEADYKAEASKNHGYQAWQRTGNAVGAIHIEKRGEYSYFIGAQIGEGHDDGGRHLYFLDEGNGGRGATITAHNPKGMNIPDLGWRKKVKGFDGYHLTEKVAKKYNG